jgi:hypothetical protein
MTYAAYSLIQELSQYQYEEVLDFSIGISPIMLLVINKSMQSSSSCDRVLSHLDRYLLEVKESNEWPGTILYGEAAIVRTYSYNDETLAIVKNITRSLYDWSLPDLPEDFCLLRNDLTPWLVTISHEKDGYFYGTESEVDRLLEFIPDLRKLITKDC